MIYLYLENQILMDYQKFIKLFLKEEIKEYSNEVYKKPLVSVVVLTHNHYPFISSCLENILNQQTHFEFEILLADDDSQDGTKELCLSYAKKHPAKIRFFPHKKSNNIKIEKLNTGIFNALYSFYEARGQYIAYCDGDDFWTDKYKLEKQVKFLEENKSYVLCYHEVKYLKSNNEVAEIEPIRKDLSSLELIQIIRQPLMNTVCFRNLLTNYPVEITKVLNADNFFVSILGKYGGGKFLENIKPSIYRIHQGGIWSMISEEEKFIHKIKTFKSLASYYRNHNPKISLYFAQKTNTYYKSLIYRHFIKKEYKKALIKFVEYLNFQGFKILSI